MNTFCLHAAGDRSVIAGPEGTIYESTDGGFTWSVVAEYFPGFAASPLFESGYAIACGNFLAARGCALSWSMATSPMWAPTARVFARFRS